MSTSLEALAKATKERVHFWLGLVSGLGLLSETARTLIQWHGWGSIFHFLVGLDWVLGATVFVAAQVFFAGMAIIFIPLSFIWRRLDEAKLEKLGNRTTTGLMVIAGVAGLIVALAWSGPSLMTLSDVVAIVVIRGIGLWIIILFITMITAFLRRTDEKTGSTEPPVK
jgi:hypothetical protein